MDGLVLGVLVPSVMSVAVAVALPAVLSVQLRVWLPLAKAASAGRVALASEALRPTVSVTFVIRFQLASTARTVTENDAPAVCEVGDPVLPLAVPGAAISPGKRSCKREKAPPFTVIAGVVLLVTLV